MDELESYLLGWFVPEADEDISEHLESCAGCRRTVSQLRRQIAMVETNLILGESGARFTTAYSA
jgi:predicted anti-sigma-YlaC factor YlaD